jgi:hypothetical protein
MFYARTGTALHLMTIMKLQFLLYNLLTNEELVNRLDWPLNFFGTKYIRFGLFFQNAITFAPSYLRQYNLLRGENMTEGTK